LTAGKITLLPVPRHAPQKVAQALPATGHSRRDAECAQIAGGETEFRQRRHATAHRRHGEPLAAAGMRLPVVLPEALEPGVAVGCEHGIRTPGLRQHLISVEQHLILERLEGNAVRLQNRGDRTVASLGQRFIVTIGKHRGHTKRPRQLGNLASGPAVANDQCAAACAQRCVEFDQRLADELDATVAASLQGVENLPVENESAIDLSSTAQRFGKRGVIVITQIAPKPDKNRFQHPSPNGRTGPRGRARRAPATLWTSTRGRKIRHDVRVCLHRTRR
jgi:hypothetical protein